MAAIIAGFTAIALIGGLYLATRTGPVDPKTLCSAGRDAPQRVIVVDKSDKWTEAQKGRLLALMQSAKDGLQEGDRLSIFAIHDGVEAGFAAKFSLCRPLRGRDVTIFTDNPRTREREFERKFGQLLTDVAEKIAQPAEAKTSPILEALVDIANRSELTESLGKARIVLVSDMVQHTDYYSLLRSVPRSPIKPSPTVPAVGGWTSTIELGPQAKATTRVPPWTPPSKAELEQMVDRKGGLRHCHKFEIEIRQIPGGKYEDKFPRARKFWDAIADLYGCRMQWKIL